MRAARSCAQHASRRPSIDIGAGAVDGFARPPAWASPINKIRVLFRSSLTTRLLSLGLGYGAPSAWRIVIVAFWPKVIGVLVMRLSSASGMLVAGSAWP